MENKNFIFEKSKIQYWDVDGCGYARPSTYLMAEQIAATSQIKHDVISNEELRKNGKALFLMQVSVQIENHLKTGDDYNSQSWPCASRFASLPRCSIIWEEDTLYAKSISTWACINLETKEVLKASEFGQDFKTGEKFSLDIPTRIVFPKDKPLVEIADFTVMKSDIDFNGHMNNTKYPDKILNYLDIELKDIIGFSISYLKEIRLSTNVKILMCEENGLFLFKFVGENGDAYSEIMFVTNKYNKNKQ